MTEKEIVLKAKDKTPDRPVCSLRHRLEVRGGPHQFACCDSRQCLFQKVVGGIRYCVYNEETG